MIKEPKPLGMKAYGSIPHLPGSRMGPADHHCHEGQSDICTVKARDRHDSITIQEKLDGSCVAVAKINGDLVAMGRSGYTAQSSPYAQHQLFAAWALENFSRFDASLLEGERMVGEWLAQAHGTRYDLKHEPFVAFDVIAGGNRLPFDEFALRAAKGGFVMPHLVHRGSPISISVAMAALGEMGHHGATEPIEGVVYRVERKGKVDFLAKYVRPDKVDGKYLESQTNEGPVWNWTAPPRAAGERNKI